MKILLAEDTRDLNKAVSTVLRMEDHSVDCAYDGVEAMDMILANGYDVIILDIMMPRKDGIQVLTEIRSKNISTPVLLLTAKAEVDDRVAGLDSGADDYLTKPFAMKELQARVRALIRRGRSYDSRELSFRDITLKTESLEMVCDNSVRLSIKEFELMHHLVKNSERSMDTAYILEHVWPEDGAAGEDVVWLYVNYLKNKLKSISSGIVIEGEKGKSFKLV